MALLTDKLRSSAPPGFEPAGQLGLYCSPFRHYRGAAEALEELDKCGVPKLEESGALEPPLRVGDGKDVRRLQVRKR